MAGVGKKRELLKGPLEKTQQCPKASAASTTIYFAQPQTQDQRGKDNMSHLISE